MYEQSWFSGINILVSYPAIGLLCLCIAVMWIVKPVAWEVLAGVAFGLTLVIAFVHQPELAGYYLGGYYVAACFIALIIGKRILVLREYISRRRRTYYY